MPRAHRPSATSLAVVLLGSGLATLAVAPTAQAATETLYVRVGGSGTTCVSPQPTFACNTLQEAIDAAADAGFTGDDVIIDVGPGTFTAATPPSVTAAGSEASLTIRGTGADGPNATVLQTATGATRTALEITADFPVTVRTLRIEGSGPAATGPGGPSGGNGEPTFGIDENTSQEITVRAVRITGLTGGTGGAGTTTNGGNGGRAVGLRARGGGDTTIVATRIDGLVGGLGGVAAAGAGTLNINGEGGIAIGVLADPGGNGDRVIVRDTQISGNTGGSGTTTPAARTRRGHAAAGIGIRVASGGLRMDASTIADNQGGNGSTGGAGTAANQNAGVGGDAGSGTGIEAAAGARLLIVRNSTITANNAGSAGAGGSGYTTMGGTGDGGAGGAGGRGFGIRTAITANVPELIHLTVTDNVRGLGGPGGTGSPAGSPGTLGNPGIGIEESGADPVLTASLLDTQESGNDNCAGAITDGGFNVLSDTTCVPIPGNPATPNLSSAFGNGTADELFPLGDYGGPTQTIAILGTSTAAKAVTDGQLCSGNQNGRDQRHKKRPIPCAAGAYEPNPVGKSTRNRYGRNEAAGPSTEQPCGAITTRPKC